MVANNTFRNNIADEGGGIRFCYFLGALPLPIVFANTITGNHAISGGGVSCFAADPVLQQTTIEGNGASAMGGGCFAHGDGHLALENSIVSGSEGGGGLYAGAGGTIATSYCDVWNNTGGDYVHCSPAASDLSCDPEYCDVMAEDHRLYEVSGCNGSGQGGNDIGARGVGCFTVPGVCFYDNFSDQDDDGWVVDTQGVAGMNVIAGCYAGEASGGGAFARSLVMDPTPVLDDYRYRARLKVGAIEPGGWAELLLRYQDAARYYRVRFDGTMGELWKQSELGASLLTEFQCALPSGVWHDLLLVAVDRQLQGFLIDADSPDHLLFSYVDNDAPILTGTIGVGVAAEPGRCAAQFDNILVALSDPSGVLDAPEAQESRLWLAADPNPSRTSTELILDLPRSGRVRVDVHDVRGALVRLLLEDERFAGRHRIRWDGRDQRDRRVPAGIYFGRVEAGGDHAAIKLLILR